MRFLVALIALGFAALAAPRADAAMWGETDNFKTLAKLTITQEQVDKNGLPKQWANDPELVEHSTSLFILAGVWVSDKGYAIKTTRDSDGYWDLDDKTVAGLQELGILPNPMPKHEMDIVDTLFGYSLYIVIAGMLVFYGLKAVFFRKPALAAPETPAQTAPAPQPGGPRAGQ